MIKCVLIILQAEFESSIASHIATPVIVKFLSKTQHRDLDSYSLNINVRKEMEDSRLNAIKQLITFVKGRLNFSCKSTTAANVNLRESLLDS